MQGVADESGAGCGWEGATPIEEKVRPLFFVLPLFFCAANQISKGVPKAQTPKGGGVAGTCSTPPHRYVHRCIPQCTSPWKQKGKQNGGEISRKIVT